MCMLHWPEPVVMNLKKIRRLMNKYGLFCPIRKANPYRRMAKVLKSSQIAANILNREFTQHGARQVLLTDITYLPYNGKFCYLSICYSIGKCLFVCLVHPVEVYEGTARLTSKPAAVGTSRGAAAMRSTFEPDDSLGVNFFHGLINFLRAVKRKITHEI